MSNIYQKQPPKHRSFKNVVELNFKLYPKNTNLYPVDHYTS